MFIEVTTKEGGYKRLLNLNHIIAIAPMIDINGKCTGIYIVYIGMTGDEALSIIGDYAEFSVVIGRITDLYRFKGNLDGI